MFQRLAFAALCALLVGSPLRADYIVSSYYDTPTGPKSNLYFPNLDGPLWLGFGSVSPRSRPGTADVQIGSMWTPVDWAPSIPIEGNYTLVVNLTDTPSGESGSVSFSATFAGWLGTLGPSFDDFDYIGGTTRSLTLGDNVYDLTIGLGPHNDAPWVKYYYRTIMAHIEVSPAVGVSQVPEPSALLLAGAGASALLAWSRRRKRAKEGDGNPGPAAA